MSTGSLLCNRYLLGRVLGAGGGSLVFQAEDRRRIGAEDFGTKIAIKLLRPEMRHNSHALTRLKREFRQMQRLTHPGIARVFELACDEDIWFMTMELIDGQTINQWLKLSTSRTEGMQIIAGCCDALSHAHEAGIVHGDLKPSNLLVLPNGGVKLVDFGSAAERDATSGEVDKERSFAATPPYASPQVLAGEIADPRDDVFSLACLTYAVLTHGEHPFDRKSSAEAQQAHMKPAYSRALLPRQFEVLVRALSWDREHRPATVRDFWHALLASDLRREPGSHTADVVSKPVPSTPTRDAPTVAAPKAEAKAATLARASALESEPTVATHASDPTPKRDSGVDSGVKQEDIARLKAAVAAAEALAERIDAPEPRAEGERAVDPMAKFRGYVAGPMAQRDAESSSIDIVPVALETGAGSASETPPKTTRRVWPWQRSAWAVAIAVAGALAAATQLDFHTDSGDTDSGSPAQARSLPSSPSTMVPVATAALAPTSEAASQPQVEEKKSPQVAVKDTTAPIAPGEISFATRTLQVGVGQTIAALSVKRTNSTRGRARVAWTIEGGTARAGIDYQLGTAQFIEFLEGQSIRSLFIPLVPEKTVGEARTSKTFTVKLQPMSGGPRLGEIKQVYVTIVGDVADERVARAE
jgi:serine/threonine protein kinase